MEGRVCFAGLRPWVPFSVPQKDKRDRERGREKERKKRTEKEEEKKMGRK